MLTLIATVKIIRQWWGKRYNCPMAHLSIEPPVKHVFFVLLNNIKVNLWPDAFLTPFGIVVVFVLWHPEPQVFLHFSMPERYLFAKDFDLFLQTKVFKNLQLINYWLWKSDFGQKYKTWTIRSYSTEVNNLEPKPITKILFIGHKNQFTSKTNLQIV